MIGKSTLTFLFIEDGSISIWTFFDLGENSSIFPVIRSSNLASLLSLISKVEAVANDINKDGGSAIAIECDVKNIESINYIDYIKTEVIVENYLFQNVDLSLFHYDWN